MYSGYNSSGGGKHSSSQTGVKCQPSYNFDMNSSEINTTTGPLSVNQTRDKSVEKKHASSNGGGSKDATRELIKVKKQLREKDKELMKTKQEVNQLKRES